MAGDLGSGQGKLSGVIRSDRDMVLAVPTLTPSRSWQWPGLRAGAAHLVAAPAIAVLTLFILAPIAMLVVQSFSGPSDGFPSLVTVARLFKTDIYWRVLLRSILFSLEVTVVTIAVSWPAAWALARYVPKRWQTLILAAMIVPFLTSYLLLIYGMLVLLAPGGPIVWLTEILGFAGDDASILYTPAATFVMLVNESVGFAMIILFVAAQAVSGDQIEAVESLGGRHWQVFRHVIWPSSFRSLVTASILTFVPTAGIFAESQILGGPSDQLIGNMISDQITVMGDLRFSAALSLLLLLSIVVVTALLLAVPRVWRLFTQRFQSKVLA